MLSIGGEGATTTTTTITTSSSSSSSRRFVKRSKIRTRIGELQPLKRNVLLTISGLW